MRNNLENKPVEDEHDRVGMEHRITFSRGRHSYSFSEAARTCTCVLLLQVTV